VTELLILRGLVHARVNWGRWIADCPSPFCRSALAVAPGTPAFTCEDCGADGEIQWPDRVDDISRMLAFRPNPVNRNWEPGETVWDLMDENARHGIMGMWADMLGISGVMLELRDDKIVVDALPTAPYLAALES
jgi:hypothetical protein